MFLELNVQNFEEVRRLFQGFDYSISIQAGLAKNNPCRIFVDDLQCPHTAFALTVEGYLLAGDPEDGAVRRSLSQFLRDRVFSGQVYIGPDWWMCLAVHPCTWETYLPEIIPTHEAEKVLCYHYQCDHVKLDWRALLPADYEIHPLSDILRGKRVAQISEELFDEHPLEMYWGSADAYLEKGIGFCIMQGEQAVALCKANCVVGDQIEVGVHTLATYRRRGLASVLAAATAEYSLEHGFRMVHWQCDSDNTGSWKTAEKVGFKKIHEYFYYDYIYDVGAQYGQLGWRAYQEGDYARCTLCYEQAFSLEAQTEGNCIAASDYYYAAAAYARQGKKEEALHYLQRAIRKGWKAFDLIRQAEAFLKIFNEAEWQMIEEKR